MAGTAFVKVAEVGDLSPGEMKMVEVGENQILLANVSGNIWACDNICSHAGASLSEGKLTGDQIECPRHGSVFSVVTGVVIDPPATINLSLFQVAIEGPDILVGPPKE